MERIEITADEALKMLGAVEDAITILNDHALFVPSISLLADVAQVLSAKLFPDLPEAD